MNEWVVGENEVCLDGETGSVLEICLEETLNAYLKHVAHVVSQEPVRI